MINRKLGVLGASVLLVAAGATTMTAQAVSSVAGESSALAGAVGVSIDGSRVITMPTTIQPGVNKFSVKVAKPGSFQLVQTAPGYTTDMATADIAAGLEKGDAKAQKRFEENTTLLGGVTAFPGTTGKLVVDLPAGDYLALDTWGKTPKFTPFTVAGADTGATAPSSKKIKAVKDVTLAKKPAAIPNKGWLTFKNASSQNHFLLVVALKPGKTYKDFLAYADGHFEGKPPVSFQNAMEVGVVDPGKKAMVKYRLPKGKYVALCFWPDANQGGMPHAMMGMHRALTLR